MLFQLLMRACGFVDEPGEHDVVLPDVDAASFDGSAIDNEYLPLPVGATWSYEADGAEGLETIEVEVLEETKTIEGVVATVVRDTAYLDGDLIEDTFDWYAQDDDGNVWYLGEDTCEYEDDKCVDTYGSWMWGVDGALPGIVMKGDPEVDGERYYQEFLEGEAEDVGEVVDEDVRIRVAAGRFRDCIKTHDTSTVDNALEEYKYYCPGIGNVLVEEADVDEELVDYDGL